MTQPTATPSQPVSLPPIPPEVQRFAEEVGAAPYLPSVLTWVRHLYPHGDFLVVLLEDAEIADYLHIAFEFDVTGWPGDQITTLMKRWSSEIVEYCPTTHTPYFTYLLRERR